MAQWEICNIEEKELKPGKKTLLASYPAIYRWEAIITNATGTLVIDCSDSFADASLFYDLNPKSKNGQEYDRLVKKCTMENNLLISRVANQGWEPAVTNQGQINQMKRMIPDSTSFTHTTKEKLLAQLSKLRRYGILSDEEYEAKSLTVRKMS
jgi:hypothetical protein